MNNLIPYISSEPPPILNESFEHDSYNPDNCFPGYSSSFAVELKSRDFITPEIIATDDSVMEIECSNGLNNELSGKSCPYRNYGRNNDLDGIRNPLDLCEYIESVVVTNNLSLDSVDGPVYEDDLDRKSEASVDGEFDEFIDCNDMIEEIQLPIDKSDIDGDLPNKCNDQSGICEIDRKIDDFIDYNEENRPKRDKIDKMSDTIDGDHQRVLSVDRTGLELPPLGGCNSPDKEREEEGQFESNFEDFGKFLPVIDNRLSIDEYFVPGDEREQLDNFADFSGVDYVGREIEDGDFEELDDDFEEFATFEQPQEPTETTGTTQIDGVECALKSLIEKFNSVESNSTQISDSMDLSLIIRGDSFISNQRIFDEMGYTVWKELINYDYSPAFIFQWMQSATYEKFMSSLGTEYREMLSSHRATLPLYSVNLTPIEPVPIDNFSQINVSASSSIIDLTSKDESGAVPPDKGSMNIDFKNLEEEFVFNHVSSTTEIKYPDDLNSLECPPSLTNNISSTVVQSERFGGILKSLLKPLNPTKTGPNNKLINPQTETILKELPDLSYMSSKVLMFPVISNCDVEDNI